MGILVDLFGRGREPVLDLHPAEIEGDARAGHRNRVAVGGRGHDHLQPGPVRAIDIARPLAREGDGQRPVLGVIGHDLAAEAGQRGDRRMRRGRGDGRRRMTQPVRFALSMNADPVLR